MPSNADPYLEIEERHNLWGTEVSGIRLWPLVRHRVLEDASTLDRRYERYMPANRRGYFQPVRWSRYLRSARFLASGRRPRYRAGFMVTNLTRYALGNKRCSFDRLYGEYFRAAASPLILESAFGDTWASPDEQYEQSIVSLDLIWLWAIVEARSRQLPAATLHIIEEFCTHITAIFGLQGREDHLTFTCANLISKYDSIRVFLERQIQPRLLNPLVILENAYYMSREGLITKACHELGINVAEVQHGLIAPMHYAYNFPRVCLQNPQHACRPYVPDTLLTFGQYWADIARIPGDTFVVGYPYLSKVVQAHAKVAPAQRQILVLSAHNVRQTTIQLVQRVAQAFPEYRIVLKLHPVELHQTSAYESCLAASNVTIVGSVDVYQLVAESEILLSAYGTTVLIEAAAFPGKRIFYSGKEGDLPDGLGSYFVDTEELIAQLSDSTAGFSSRTPEEFWSTEWEGRLVSFLESTCPITG